MVSTFVRDFYASRAAFSFVFTHTDNVAQMCGKDLDGVRAELAGLLTSIDKDSVTTNLSLLLIPVFLEGPLKSYFIRNIILIFPGIQESVTVISFGAAKDTSDTRVERTLHWMIHCLKARLPFVDVFHPELSD
eukprot:12635303-Heterocapsa_arctica.AAC.1